jgi:hypothetical protein
MTNSSFRKIYGPNMTARNVLFHQNNFFSAILPRMHIILNVYIPITIDFTNVDLIDSYLTYDNIQMELTEHLIEPTITILNARLPNGSFIRW